MSRHDKALWARLHTQLDTLGSELARADTLSAEACASLLAERQARWSAAPPQRVDALLTTIAFTLGTQTYAIARAQVDAVLPIRQLTPIPGAPDFVRGIVSVLGRVVSVVDLRVLLGAPRQGLADRNHLLILRDDNMEFGLLADRILGVHDIASSQIQTTVSGLDGLARHLVHGLTPAGHVLLDGARLLTEPTLCIEQLD